MKGQEHGVLYGMVELPLSQAQAAEGEALWKAKGATKQKKQSSQRKSLTQTMVVAKWWPIQAKFVLKIAVVP